MTTSNMKQLNKEMNYPVHQLYYYFTIPVIQSSVDTLPIGLRLRNM